MLLVSTLAAPGPLRAVDPTPAPETHGDMFRQPEGTTEAEPQPRGPLAPAVIGPEGFHDTTVFSGLFSPTSVAFAADGRVFVAEKQGKVKVFDSLSDPTPSTYADLTVKVYDYWDRGMLGLALDPAFATNGRVYVLYTYNHILGDPAPAPKWVNGMGQDICPNPPGPTTDGCVASARLSRLETGAAGTWDGNEHVLVEGWCQVSPSHSIGTVAFGPDGALYAGAGESASFVNKDYGQDFGPGDDTTPDNPCGDPPSPVGTALSPPSAEGGSLRAQDLRTSGDPAGLSGTIIRIDPTTGAAKSDNANIGSPDVNARRIIAYGLRNPYRFAFRPGTNELWIGDVGDLTWEEFNRVLSPTAAPPNFGWPCYEGAAKKGTFDSFNLTLCENLYAAGTAKAPYYAYSHGEHVVPGDPCPDAGALAGSVISGTAFYPTSGGLFPAKYNGAFFFADYGRNCIWALPAGAGGLPDASKIEVFASGLSGPVDLRVGPDGALYYVAFDDGTVHRITVGPTAVATANPTSGLAPLVVQFNGSASTDPKGGALSYAWDLDGDGLFDDSTAVAPTKTYTENGVVVARLKVTDALGGFDIASVTINVGNHAPVAKISTPSSSLTWSVGDTITYSGSATDAEDGAVPASKLAWAVVIQHCPDACHNHTIQTGTGSGGSFPAPDHPYPSSLEIRLVATDSDGAPSSRVTVKLLPKTVGLSFASQPAGVQLTAGETTAAAPFTRTFINKSLVQVTAPSTATIGGRPYAFAGWSDGKARIHTVTAQSTTPPLVATYAPATTFVPIAPVRVVDTRVGSSGPMAAGVTRTFAVAGTHGIPTMAIAVTGNLTAVRPTLGGWIELSTGPGVTPTTSSLNLPAGDTRANGVTMRLGPDGKGSAVYRAPSGTTHLILDVTGYFLPTDTGATFTPIGPTRVLDSRSGAGGFSSPFVSGALRTIQLGGRAGIPADALAVTGNLTVTGQTAAGYVAMTTAATSPPAVSTINFPVGDTRANGLTIRLNANGRASLVYIGGKPGVSTADLIFDVTGFYRAGSAGLHFYPIEGRRIFDTRAANAPRLQAGLPRTIDVLGAGAIADDALAVATNVTVVGQTAAGYLAVTTVATTSPTTSTINFPLGDTRANNTLNALDTGGRLWAIYKAPAGSRTHFIVDLVGFFR
jgi:glucose/arabinose dehydrogenase/PKD repeat protein